MKKIVVFLSCFILGNLMAQSIKFGVKAGLNLANLTNIENSGIKKGFHLGGVSEFEVNDRFYVQPELLFSVHGTKIIDNDNKDNSIRLVYVTIPFMMKYYIKGGLCAEAGPYVSFNLSSYQGRNDYAKDISEDIAGLDYGIGLGLNYMLSNTLNFGLRYNLGISQVFVDNDKSIRNGVFCISVGWLL